MFRPTCIAAAALCLLTSFSISAQQRSNSDKYAPQKVSLHNATVGQMQFLGETPAYSEWNPNQTFADPTVRSNAGVLVPHDEGNLENKGLHAPNPNAPFVPDPALQTVNGTKSYQNRGLDLSIDGIGNTGVSPADPCLDVGPNHVIEMINAGSGAQFQIFDKSGNALGAAVYLDNFTGSVGGLGDPIVLYDAMAERWLMSEFSQSGNQLLVAISTTADPTGTWFAYAYTAPNFPDYPKYSVWTDMYMVTSNEGGGCPIYALDRTAMLAGTSGTFQRFETPDYPTIGFQATTPITFDNGSAPPAGAPATLMRMADDAWSSTIPNDRLEIWELSVDFSNSANSVLSGPDYLVTDPFDTELCGYTSFNCMQQPGSGTTLDPLREVIMNRAQYRNFGTHESIVCNHVTDVNGSDQGGIRWYELRRTGGPTNPWSIYQQGTYAPDGDTRWMAGIAINASGDIGMAYSVSSSTTAPSLRFTGRNSTDPLGTMSFAETSIVAGSSANSSNRWGDYFSLDSDPTTGSFWGVGCYNPSSAWVTRVFEFSLPPSAPDYLLDATSSDATVCVPNDGAYTINSTSVLGYSDPISFTSANVPVGLGVSFSVNPLTPGSSSTVTVTGTNNLSAGSYSFDVNATSTSGNKSLTFNLTVSDQPSVLSQTDPVDGATAVSSVLLQWNADALADSYEVDIASDAGFSTIIDAATGISTNSYSPSGLAPTTTYYWRVRSVNTCGTSANSGEWSFTTDACQSLTVTVLTDRYGAETTWRIEDDQANVFATGGPYVTETTNGEYPQPSVSICLPDGCYLLIVDDSFGDGICCAYGNGEIAVVDAGSNALASAASFGTTITVPFTIGSSGSCINPTPYVEDFESVSACNATWNNVSGDDFDWTLNSGDTPSDATGPTADHTTGSGSYYYTETSTPVDFSDVAILESSCIDITGAASIDVEFWYHMYGAEIGTLELQALEGSDWNTFWTLTGDQGDVWSQAVVNIPTSGGLSKLRFRAEVGTLGNSWQNDFAIDDISLTSVAGDVLLSIDMLLEGPYEVGAGTMKDDMRAGGLVPTSEPYTSMGYTFVGGGGESITPAVLAVSGSDAIVDWVIVELRDANDNTSIVSSRAALLQRDGDIVDLDGTSDISMAATPADYFVAVRHRNHLGTMIDPETTLSAAPAVIDLTDPATSVFGTDARKDIAGTMVLWAGNVVFDNSIKYTGQGNDRDPILSAIGGSVPTATINAYATEDVNLDGTIKYTGTGNDRDPILINIGGSVPTSVKLEQLP